ncbi:MAG: GNAT family N-acetyltransferase [Oscillospiraceae bacterium]|nr:GNAT family N-acetyltransferase [Oscillospiraceae bacterium]
MIDEIYNLYLECFPNYRCSRMCFEEFLKPEQAVLFTQYMGDRLAAFVMIWGNSIALLCVDLPYRNMGFGSRLLRKAEEHIINAGADKIILGHGSHYLLQGVPTTDKQTVPFFEKRGYTAEWTSANMILPLESYNINSINIPALPPNISFRFAVDVDKEALLLAVDDAEPHWRGIFEACSDPVILAIESGTNRIVGFAIMSKDGGRFLDGAGCIGCVGVVQSARAKGIGRRVVAEGIEWLKIQGIPCVELRYVELVDWYKALGFQVIGWQWMGEKATQTLGTT